MVFIEPGNPLPLLTYMASGIEHGVVLQKRFESYTTFQSVLVHALHLVLCI